MLVMRRTLRGLTLIELMTAVALVAIIGALAAPGMRGFAAGQRVKALANDLAADFALARSEALKRQLDVTVTPDSTGWQNGWAVAAAGEVLSRRESAASGVTASGTSSAITFGLNGRVSAPIGAVRVGIQSDAAGSVSQRCVELDASGRTRARLGACT
jgi:type IV fimbrial biogenesis protein FimT